MAKLLYVEASPRKKRSTSIAVAEHFLEQYRTLHPNDEIVMKDLWEMDLPQFDGAIIDAKYAIMHGQPHTEAEAQAWKHVELLIEEFKSADKYVFSLPMWNYGIPYKLKHYIDLLVQPGYLFTVKEGQYIGLVGDKKVLAIYSRGGAYVTVPDLEYLDLQKAYMETVFKFIGFKDIQSIVIEPTLGGEEKKKETLEQAEKSSKQIAKDF